MFWLVATLPPLTIREVADRSGCTASALRYYEEQGLICALPRPATGSRRYAVNVLDTLHVITSLRRAGFSISDIRQFLSIKVKGESRQQRLKRATEALDRLQAQLEERRAALAEAEKLLQAWQAEVQQAQEKEGGPA